MGICELQAPNLSQGKSFEAHVMFASFAKSLQNLQRIKSLRWEQFFSSLFKLSAKEFLLNSQL